MAHSFETRRHSLRDWGQPQTPLAGHPPDRPMFCEKEEIRVFWSGLNGGSRRERTSQFAGPFE